MSKFPKLQWAIIVVANVIALLYYFEVIFFPYPIFLVGGFELVVRSIFSDVIALTQRTKRNYPLTWWASALVFPLPTLLYLYFFPFGEDRPQRIQHKYDLIFAVACLFYLAVSRLFAYWW